MEYSIIYLLYIYLFPPYLERAECDTRPIFKRCLTGLNSAFSFAENSNHAKVKDLCLPYYLHIAFGRIIGFIPFPKYFSSM